MVRGLRLVTSENKRGEYDAEASELKANGGQSRSGSFSDLEDSEDDGDDSGFSSKGSHGRGPGSKAAAKRADARLLRKHAVAMREMIAKWGMVGSMGLSPQAQTVTKALHMWPKSIMAPPYGLSSASWCKLVLFRTGAQKPLRFVTNMCRGDTREKPASSRFLFNQRLAKAMHKALEWPRGRKNEGSKRRCTASLAPMTFSHRLQWGAANCYFDAHLTADHCGKAGLAANHVKTYNGRGGTGVALVVTTGTSRARFRMLRDVLDHLPKSDSIRRAIIRRYHLAVTEQNSKKHLLISSQGQPGGSNLTVMADDPSKLFAFWKGPKALASAPLKCMRLDKDGISDTNAQAEHVKTQFNLVLNSLAAP